jgi:hypothetical protein
MNAIRWIWVLAVLVLPTQVLAHGPIHVKRYISGWVLSRGDALAVQSNGNPVLGVYRERGSTRELAWYRCSDPECIKGTVFQIASLDHQPISDAFAIGVSSNDAPVAAYVIDDKVYYAWCVGASCTSGQPIAQASPGVAKVAMVINSAGLAVIAYATSSGSLFLVNCADPQCGTKATVSLANNLADATFAIALAANDEPRILYGKSSSGATTLSMISCGSALCLAPTEQDVISGGDFPFLRLAIDRANDKAYFSWTLGQYLSFVSAGAVVSECLGAAACASGIQSSYHYAQNEAVAVAPADPAAIVIGVDGLPLVAHVGGTVDRSMYIMHGRPRDFTHQAGRRTVVDPNAFSNSVSLRIRPDGRPVLAYAAGTLGTYVISCDTRTCS